MHNYIMQFFVSVFRACTFWYGVPVIPIGGVSSYPFWRVWAREVMGIDLPSIPDWVFFATSAGLVFLLVAGRLTLLETKRLRFFDACIDQEGRGSERRFWLRAVVKNCSGYNLEKLSYRITGIHTDWEVDTIGLDFDYVILTQNQQRERDAGGAATSRHPTSLRAGDERKINIAEIIPQEDKMIVRHETGQFSLKNGNAMFHLVAVGAGPKITAKIAYLQNQGIDNSSAHLIKDCLDELSYAQHVGGGFLCRVENISVLRKPNAPGN